MKLYTVSATSVRGMLARKFWTRINFFPGFKCLGGQSFINGYVLDDELLPPVHVHLNHEGQVSPDGILKEGYLDLSGQLFSYKGILRRDSLEPNDTGVLVHVKIHTLENNPPVLVCPKSLPMLLRRQGEKQEYEKSCILHLVNGKGFNLEIDGDPYAAFVADKGTLRQVFKKNIPWHIWLLRSLELL